MSGKKISDVLEAVAEFQFLQAYGPGCSSKCRIALENVAFLANSRRPLTG
jgi:hypothetical protein